MSSRKISNLTPEDMASWLLYTQNVKPLKDNVPQERINCENDAALPERSTVSIVPHRPQPFHTPSAKSLKNIKIESRIDLHGHTQQQAHERVTNFILWSHDKKMRCVLIITGKGNENSEEWWSTKKTLRQEVPRWLHEDPIRSKISSYSEAKIEHGGSGALYIFLKKH